VLVVALLAATAGCGRRSQHPFVTYFNPEPALTLQIPSNWTSEQVEQEGRSYRYFLAPPVGSPRKPAVSVALLAGSGGRLDEHAQRYLTGQTVASSREVSRSGLAGKSWRLTSPDGATKYSLFLVSDNDQTYGLYGQAEAAHFDQHAAAIDQMEKTLTPERPERYPEHRNDKLGFSVRVPDSWKTTRNFSGGETYLMQFTSPALGAENGQTIHAILTLTSEAAPGDGNLDVFYKALRARLGEPSRLISHTRWKDGYVDVERAESPVSVSRVKRFYRAHGTRGYTLAFEARDDVFHRVSRWCDIIAATLAVGAEVTPK
jgi:hypothetical protein